MNRDFIQNLQVKDSLTTQEISKAVDILFTDLENAPDAAELLSRDRHRSLTRDTLIYAKIRKHGLPKKISFYVILALRGYQYRPIDNILVFLLSKPNDQSEYIFNCLYSGNKALAAKFWIQEIKKTNPALYQQYVKRLKYFPVNDLKRIKAKIVSVPGYHRKYNSAPDEARTLKGFVGYVVDLRSMFDAEINRLLKPEKKPLPLVARNS